MEEVELTVVELLMSYPTLMIIASIISALVVAATTIVGLTTTKADDKYLAKIRAIPVVGYLWGLFERFSLLKTKAEAKREQQLLPKDT